MSIRVKTALLATALVALSSSLDAVRPVVFHPLDRPLADLTLEVVDDKVRATLMLNYKFIDSILGTKADPLVPPSQDEYVRTEESLRRLFAEKTVLTYRSESLPPTQVEDFQVAEPLDVLREAAPDYVRALTQVQFSMTYTPPPGATQLTLTWGFYPEHPLTDAPDSPLVPMKMRAVVVREAGAEVLTFERDTPTQKLALPVFASRGPQGEKPREASVFQPTASYVLGGLILLIFTFGAVLLKLRNQIVAALLLGVLCTSCTPGAESPEAREWPARHDVETTSWKVSVRFKPKRVPANEHFEAEVTVQSQTAGGKPPATIVADADMPAHGHGMNTKPRVSKLADGRWRVEGLLFHMPGAWEFYVDIGAGQKLERAKVPLDLPTQ